MTDVGLRELRQNASSLVRRVEAGEEITITVSGRPSARLVAVAPAQWNSFADIVDLFEGPEDADWPDDQQVVDGRPRDPWSSRGA